MNWAHGIASVMLGDERSDDLQNKAISTSQAELF